VTVGAGPRLLPAHRVGHEGRERRAREAGRRDRLLLRVDPLAVLVLRGREDRARRTGGRDPAAAHRAVARQREDVVAQGLEVVANPVAARFALVVQIGLLLRRRLREVAAEAARGPGRVAREAGHLRVVVRERLSRARRAAPARSVPEQRLGVGRALVEARVARCHRVPDLRHLPLAALLDHAPLQQLPLAAGEAGQAERRRLQGQVGPTRCGTRGTQRRRRTHRPVAVDAVDLDRGARLAVEHPRPVHVLAEVAVDAVHPALEVDVAQVDGLRELRGVARRDRLARRILELPLAVALVHRAEDPAVAVEVGELRALQAGIERLHLRQELRIRPQAPERGALGVSTLDEVALGSAELARLGGIHRFAVELVVPERVAHEARDHVGAGMHVAGHALARRNARGEDVPDRVPRLVLRQRGIGARRAAAVAGRGVGTRVHRRAVVRVHHVAGAAAARAVIAGVVVRAEEREQRIEETRLLRAEDHRVDAVERPRAAERQAHVGTSRLCRRVGKTGLGPAPATGLEGAEGVARGADLEAREGEEHRQDALAPSQLRGGRRRRAQHLRAAVRAVALPDHGVLARQHAVVVERGAVEHRTVRHHARGDVLHLLRVTATAGLRCRAQVARVHEADEGQVLLEQRRVAALGVAARGEEPAVARPYVRLLLRFPPGVRPGRARGAHRGVAAVAVGAGKPHGRRDVHRCGVGLRVAIGAASGGM